MRERRPYHEAWIWVTTLALVVGYVFALPGLLVIAGVLAVILGLAWLWNRQSLLGVRYRRWLRYRRGFPGETVEAHVSIDNNKLLPLVWLRLTDRWPLAVGPSDPEVLSPSHRPDEGFLNLILAMRGRSKTRRELPLSLRQRGLYQLGPVSASSGDPFGVFVTERDSFARDDRVVVFPQLQPLSQLGLKPDDPFGEQASRRRLYEDITRPAGVRDYRPSDGFRRIHWPATASQGRLQTRLFQPVRGLDLVVCMNASTFAHHWEGTDPEMLEALIRATASLVYEAYQQGYRVGLLSNGGIAHAGQAFRIPPGRSRQHLARLLESLAGLTPVVTAPFERYLMAQAPRLEYGSILIITTAVTPPALLQALGRLRLRNRRTSLISLAQEAPPFVEGVNVHHAPAAEPLRLA